VLNPILLAASRRRGTGLKERRPEKFAPTSSSSFSRPYSVPFCLQLKTKSSIHVHPWFLIRLPGEVPLIFAARPQRWAFYCPAPSVYFLGS
jgi:hypothetical protein